MAFVSNAGNGLLPQTEASAPGSRSELLIAVQASTTQFTSHQHFSALTGSSQLMDTLLLQQQQQQQHQQVAEVGSTLSPSSQLVSHFLASALLNGSNSLALMNQLTSSGSSANIESQGMQLFSVLQDQFVSEQLLPLQGSQNVGGINSIVNPAALYYQYILQQQQQKQTVLQQLVQQPVSTSEAALRQHKQFHSPVTASSGNVDSQMNAQERLMSAYLNEQQEPSISCSVLSSHERTLVSCQLASGRCMQHTQHHHDSTFSGAVRSSAATGSTIDAESVEEKISRLISENEAIVQPSQALLKRRPYHRQAGGLSATDHEYGNAGEYDATRTPPGIRNHRTLQSSNRNQSHYDPFSNAKSSFGGSLTSGLPVNRSIKQDFLPTCSFCLLTFPNEAGLQVHEVRCSRKAESIHADAEEFRVDSPFMLQTPTKNSESDAYSRYPLKKRLLAAVACEQQGPSKIPRPESGDIVIHEQKTPTADMKEDVVEVVSDTCRRITTVSAGLNQPRGHFIAAPNVVSSMMHQLHASVPLYTLQIGANSSVFASPPCTNYIPARADVNQLPEKEENPFSIEGHMLDGNTEKPYTLMLTHSCKMQSAADVSTIRRSRGRNITSETFVCMHRAQPMFVEQKGNLSMYSNWHQVSINEAESKLNLLYMGMCSTRPRTGVKPFWRYSIANRDHGQYKMTHSSFWEYRNKIKRQTGQVQSANTTQNAIRPFEAVEQDTKPPVDEANATRSPSKLGSKDSVDAEIGEELTHVAAPNVTSTAEATRLWKSMRKQDPVIGGYRTDEVYVYVRGRGRGRYVCDRCGIRCKKPSMLNKHIRSHTDIRPYNCKECNFSFKTKGNWTKHLNSKTHRKRLVQGSGNDSENDDGLVIASPDDDVEQCCPYNEMDSLLNRSSSDEEADDHLPLPQEAAGNAYRKFGQEVILFERMAHTPPSRWMLADEEVDNRWPDSERTRNCSSAPPSAASPVKEDAKEELMASSTMLSSLAVSVILTLCPTSGSHVQQLQHNHVVQQPTTSIYSYSSREESMKCKQCERSFRKASEFQLHQYTHDLEKHTRNKMFQMDERVTANLDPRASTQSVLGGSAPTASNPRSFICSDCKIGFRKHGILAKHLRSKTHVMKLETLKRIPEDSLSLITKKDNGACLNTVDTTDCEKARISLFEIVEAIRAENQGTLLQTLPASRSTALKTEVKNSHIKNVKRREEAEVSPAVAQEEAVDMLCSGLRTDVETTHLQNPLCSDDPSCASSEASNPCERRYRIHLGCESLARVSPNLHHQAEGMNDKHVSGNLCTPSRAAECPLWFRTDLSNILPPQDFAAQFRDDNEEGQSACLSPNMGILCNDDYVSSPPMFQCTQCIKCQICGVNADSPVDLQVHIYSDHISLRDGKDLKCPKPSCDKVYPNKDSLRLHIVAHYQHRFDAALGIEAREDDSVSSVTSVFANRLADDITDQRGSPLSDESDSSWLGADVSRVASVSDLKRSQEDEQSFLHCTL